MKSDPWAFAEGDTPELMEERLKVVSDRLFVQSFVVEPMIDQLKELPHKYALLMQPMFERLKRITANLSDEVPGT